MTLPQRPAFAWGYARVSDPKQISQNDSIPFQKERIEALYRFALAPLGVNFGGVETDNVAVSARKRPFSLRKAGARLLNLMQPGDHLIIDKIDRLTRRPKDLCEMIEWFDTHNIELHICNLFGSNIATKSAQGRFMIQLFGLLAEWESDQISERVNAHNLAARKIGRAISPHGPAGTRTFRRKSSDGKVRSYVAWDAERRALMAEVVRRREILGESYKKIWCHLERLWCLSHGYQFKNSAFSPRHYSLDQLRHWYAVEKYYVAHKIVDICDIPVNVDRLAFSEFVKGRSH